MLNTFQEQSTLQIPIQTQKFILIDNHLLIPLIVLNSTYIYEHITTLFFKIKYFINSL
jgi:hypothetical protein